jgi:hypothetical protein
MARVIKSIIDDKQKEAASKDQIRASIQDIRREERI